MKKHSAALFCALTCAVLLLTGSRTPAADNEEESSAATATISMKPHPKTTVQQGLYEISSAADDRFVLDVRYCTVHEEDSHTLQLYPPLNIGQQKFYLEELPGSVYRISVLSSGEGLTAGEVSEDGASFSRPVSTAAIPRQGGRAVLRSQTWRLEDAGDGLYYLRAQCGKYLTLDASSPYRGASVSLRNFKGKSNQKWKLQETFISADSHADTDLINPWQEDGAYSGLLLTMPFGKEKIQLTSSDLAAWVTETQDHEMRLDFSMLSAWVEQLAAQYDTQGHERRFHTSYGQDITLYKGDFGWKLDTAQTAQAIEQAIRQSGRVTLDPVWAHKGVSFERGNDIGDSYVEVDLTGQKTWVYVDGKQILQTDCVTGTYQTDRQTPGGVYSVYYRQSPAVLRGEGYESYVDYWMAFYGGYGLHDANWRSSFGGDIYLYDGSHGCVNLPTDAAAQIYEIAQIGFPVVLYN